MSSQDLKEKLYAPLPNEAIKQHPTKTYLSSIKAIYVTDRFNDVFGIGKWQTKVEKEHLNIETGMVVVKVIFTVPDLNIYYESYGGNDNGGASNKNFDLGDAYKGATTDAITKIGSFLGVAIDVFKGKTDNSPKQQNQDRPKVTNWLSEDKFKEALADKEKAKKALEFFDGKTNRDGKIYGMKSDYRKQLKTIK